MSLHCAVVVQGKWQKPSAKQTSPAGHGIVVSQTGLGDGSGMQLCVPPSQISPSAQSLLALQPVVQMPLTQISPLGQR